VTEYIGHFRQLVGDTLRETQEPIGGPGVIVEIDESKFGKRKYHRGHRVDGVWVFGGIERTPERRIFVKVVENRTEKVLLKVLRDNVRPGSIIYSDMWSGYRNIERELEMEHRTVNHSECFVDPDTGVHTNTVEGMWNGFKLKIPPRRRTSTEIGPNLLEIVWRRQNWPRLWDAFLRCLEETRYV
jgi:transposase-like protein